MHEYHEYRELGLTVIPIRWDSETKQPVSHRLWSNADDLQLRPDDNGIMIKTGNGYGCLDFDLKNTKDKELFNKWMGIISNEAPDILNNLFIEQTRNKGYHVWMKYANLPTKTALAESSEGSEVIALYSNGPVVYTYPTPGYTEWHQSMADVVELTEHQFNYLIEVSQYFNEYKPKYDPNKKAVSYPVGYEQQLSEFDGHLTDEQYDSILAEIGLYPVDTYQYSKKDKFTAYRRKGSESAGISAKVYYQSRRVMIFSASLHTFPNWHNRHEYPVWSLPPSFLLFYHLNRDWKAVLKRIGIEDTANGYPTGIFPHSVEKSIQEVAEEKSLYPEFLATAGLFTIASLAGNCYTSELPDETKNIIFALMIAPVSVGKTPAFKAMCENPLKDLMAKEDREYEEDVKRWTAEKIEANANKQPFGKPHPKRFIPFAVDGTTEGYIGLMQDQQAGMGVYHDEAETILNAGAHKANNDAISFFTQAFSGGRYTQIRADRTKERVVKSLNMSLLMGTQPSRLKNLFGADRIQSGFASRFLMVQSDYLKLKEDVSPFNTSRAMCDDWKVLLYDLYKRNKAYCSSETPQIQIIITDEARPILEHYYRQQRRDANQRHTNKVDEYVMGTEAKMSAYYFRFCHLIAIAHNTMVPMITTKVAETAWKLYRWYADSTLNILSQIYQENESGLPADLRLLMDNLPPKFTTKEAEALCIRLNIRSKRFIDSMRRPDFARHFKRIAHGQYEKLI